ncbi:phosphotransferase [Propionibacteriaceae bacterium Y2011]
MQPDTYLHGARTRWHEAPAEVQDWVLARSGPLVDEPRDCRGGMATGVAAVVPGAERAVFVKAIDAVDNPVGARMYTKEADQARRLPRHPTIPRLVDSAEVPVPAGTWRVNLLEAHPGSPPRHPWQVSDLSWVITAWAELQPMLAATPWDTSAELSAFFTGWREIAADPTDPWQSRAAAWVDREEALCEVIDGGEAAVLSHIDLRADNILIGRTSAEVSFVDWAHPGLAAPWADLALLLADVVASGVSVEAGGAIDVVDLFATHRPEIDPALVVTLIAALGAFLHVRAHREQVLPAMPHRHRWSAAASEGILPFIEAHSR